MEQISNCPADAAVGFAGPTHCDICGEWPARQTDRGRRCHLCETREWCNEHPVPLLSNMETDALRDLYENHEHRATVGDIWELCESLERERDEARRAAIRWQNAWMNDTPLHEMGSTLMPWSKMCIRAEIQS